MLADPLLQSGIVTPVTILFIVLNDIVLIVFECAAQSTRKSIWENRLYLGKDPEPELSLKWP